MKSWKYSLIKSVLAMLGFASCDPKSILDEPDMYGSVPVEYGQPYVSFSFKGRAGTKDGDAIPGIRVVVAPYGLDDPYSQKDTLITDKEGRVELGTRGHWDRGFDQMEVKFEDIDGVENGSYDPLVLKKDGLQIERIGEGDGRWRWGDYQITAEAELPEHRVPEA